MRDEIIIIEEKTRVQYLFNRVWERSKIKSQANIIFEDGTYKCAYRIDPAKGNKPENCCFIGFLISDEYYNAEIEGLAVNSKSMLSILRASFGVNMETLYMLIPYLIKLQAIHDLITPSSWEHHLRRLAREYSLELPS